MRVRVAVPLLVVHVLVEVAVRPDISRTSSPGTAILTSAAVLIALAQVPARIRRGRPVRLLVRAAVAVVLSLVVLQLVPGTPAAPADVFGLVLWFALTGRKDLAPPPER